MCMELQRAVRKIEKFETLKIKIWKIRNEIGKK